MGSSILLLSHMAERCKSYADLRVISFYSLSIFVRPCPDAAGGRGPFSASVASLTRNPVPTGRNVLEKNPDSYPFPHRHDAWTLPENK